jgi:hypothetical protein
MRTYVVINGLITCEGRILETMLGFAVDDTWKTAGFYT